MLNHIKRNLTVFNKDIAETSWLKSLMDDVPKPKHIVILRKCLFGEYDRVDPKQTLNKITLRLQCQYKPLTAIKIIYLIHKVGDRFLIRFLTEKLVDQKYTKEPAQALQLLLAQQYIQYLRESKSMFDKINNIHKMHRQLEVLILKLNLPILKLIVIILMEEIILTYKQLDKTLDYDKFIRSAKQVRRFLSLKNQVQIPKELQNEFNQLDFSDLSISFQERSIETNLFIREIQISQNIHQKPQLQEFFDTPIQPKIFSAATSVRSKFMQPDTQRIPQNEFFVPNENPLSFIIHQ